LLPWAEANGLGGRSIEELCAHPDVSAAVFESMQREGKSSKLRGFENARAIHLEPELWTVYNGMFTPTFKLKRPRAKEHYQLDIQRMYQSLHH
jgi:long-chain acyl-CoA synthetase